MRSCRVKQKYLKENILKDDIGDFWVFNDDKYDYDTVGFPFLKNLGKVIYEYELTRVLKKQADLSKFKFNYIE